MTAAERVGLAMFPLRLFLGVTFVYAGLDKLLLDPTFLEATAPTSLLAQLHGFAHSSPLAPLITFIAEPLVVPIGIGIALAEIGTGLGALTGLLPRASAWGGFAIAMLLWLTASFAIHPFYLGPDLPYAAGWLTLALVGDGGVMTLRPAFARWAVGLGLTDSLTDEADQSRRRFLEGAALGAVALATGGLALLFGTPGRSALAAELAAAAAATPTPSATGAASGTATPTPAGAIGTMATLTK
ncbi:MAG: TQO small subunit DoxD, partial [Candidatus Limnocylindrales bacterium]